MNTPRYLALFLLAGSYTVSIGADTVTVPAVSIEEAIKKGQALMADHHRRVPELRCFISKVEYKESPDEHYWSIFWSGKNPRSCFSEVRVFNNGEAIFVVGY